MSARTALVSPLPKTDNGRQPEKRERALAASNLLRIAGRACDPGEPGVTGRRRRCLSPLPLGAFPPCLKKV